MIKCLSPYNVTIPFVSVASGETCTSYTLEIYVWDGDKTADVPLTPTRSITKNNTTNSTGNDVINIARILEPLITLTPKKNATTAIIDGENQRWVKTQVTYVSAEPTDATVPQYATTTLLLKGYSYGNEGENAQPPSNLVYVSGDEYKVSRNSFICLPIKLGENPAVSENISITSFPDGDINYALSELGTTESAEQIKYVIVDVSEAVTDTYITIVYNSQTITYDIEDECRFTPIDVFFFNKEGVQQSITFMKYKEDSMSVTDSFYESDTGQPSLGFHQNKRYNVNAKSSFKINSGFVSELNNDTFKQLMLTTRAWILASNTFTPINVKIKNITYKTRAKDRLINYEFEFEYAYNEINNV